MSVFNAHRDRVGEAYRALSTASTALITGPAVEPLSLAEAKSHVRRGSETADDNDLSRLIRVARRKVEEDTGRALVTQTLELRMTDPPAGRLLFLPRPPLQTVVSVTTYDADDVATVLAAGDYIVDTAAVPGRLTVKSTVPWPAHTLREANGIAVRFTAGYGPVAYDVPAPLTQAMLLLIGGFFEHREHVIVSQFAGQFIELPRGYNALIGPFKVRV